MKTTLFNTCEVAAEAICFFYKSLASRFRSRSHNDTGKRWTRCGWTGRSSESYHMSTLCAIEKSIN